jgi:glycosyltransferase involved in cell wall biosynthesis
MHASSSLNGRHVLLVAEYYSSGGTRTYLQQLLGFYAESGARVTLVTNLETHDAEMLSVIGAHEFSLMTYSEVLESQVAPNVWSRGSWLRERSAFRSLARAIGADRVVVSAGTPGLFFGALAALPRGIYILHTYPHGRRQRVLGRHYLSRRIPRGTRFIAVSEFERAVMTPMWNLNRRSSTVVSVVSTTGPLAANTSQPHQPWMVITAALVEDYKRPFDWIDLAVEVSRRLSPAALRFVWLGEGSLLEEARSAAAKVAHLANIEFPGLETNPSAYYELGRLYVQISSIENMSLSVLDAQRHGMPCVVTDVGGLPEIIQSGRNGYVVSPHGIDAAADAVCHLLSSPEEWHRFASESHRLYVEHHSPERWAEALRLAHE